VDLYFSPLKEIFLSNHRDSLLYSHFSRTRHTLYLILYILVTYISYSNLFYPHFLDPMTSGTHLSLPPLLSSLSISLIPAPSPFPLSPLPPSSFLLPPRAPLLPGSSGGELCCSSSAASESRAEQGQPAAKEQGGAAVGQRWAEEHGVRWRAAPAGNRAGRRWGKVARRRGVAAGQRWAVQGRCGGPRRRIGPARRM